MNIIDTGNLLNIEAKLFGQQNNKSITYSFIEAQHTLYLDKREILLSQIQACDRLLKYLKDESDIKTINNEISSLKMSLDFMLY
jgi:predicted phosphatase